MPPDLHLFPETLRDAWLAHPWHEAIEHFQLPECALEVHRDALLIPDTLNQPERSDATILDRHGQPLAAARHLRRSKVFNATEPPRTDPPEPLPGRHLYLGWFFNHYGHFLLESLGRAWALNQVRRLDGVLFHIAGGPPSPRLLELLALLGLAPRQIRFVTRPLQVEELLLPAQRAVLGRAMGAETVALFQSMAERAWHKEALSPRGNGKLYLSRRLLAPDQRVAADEWRLERWFQRRGYQVLHPQLLTPHQQLSLYWRSSAMAGLDGSGLHNLLFCAEPGHLWMLGAVARMADAITQVTLARWRDCDTTVVLGEVPEIDGLPPQTTPFLLPELPPEAGVTLDPGPTPWQRLRWLRALALQLERHNAPSPGLPDPEARALLKAERAHQPPSGNGPLARLARGAGAFLLNAHGEDVDFLLERAERQRQAGKTAAARDTLAQAQALAPEDPRLELLQARLSPEPEQALARLQALADHYPLFRPGVIELCERLAAAGRMEEAAQRLQRLLEPHPAQARLWCRLTWYHYRAGTLDAARQAARTALRLEPDNPFSAAHLAHIELAAGNPGAAVRWLERALQVRPGDAGLQQLQQRIRQAEAQASPAQTRG